MAISMTQRQVSPATFVQRMRKYLDEKTQRWGNRIKDLGPNCVAMSHRCAEYVSPERLTQENNLVSSKAWEIARPYMEKRTKFLDVGTGPGFLARAAIPEILDAGAYYYGVEQSPEILAGAKRLLKKSNINTNSKQIRLQVGHATQLTWGDGSVLVEDEKVDFIFLGRLLYHLTIEDEYKFVLEEICQALKPGGLILVYGAEIDLNAELYAKQLDIEIPDEPNPFWKNGDTVFRWWKNQEADFNLHRIFESGQQQRCLLSIFPDIPEVTEIYTYRLMEKSKEGHMHYR